MQAGPPQIDLLPQNDLLEVTVVLLSCLYHGKEFVRVGYYVNNEYTDESLAQEPPQQVVVEKLQRNILADKPKVTRYVHKTVKSDYDQDGLTGVLLYRYTIDW